VDVPLSGPYWTGGEAADEPHCGQSTNSKSSSKNVSIGICKQLRNSTKKNPLGQRQRSTDDYKSVIINVAFDRIEIAI
jgi:hypothetical protein